MDTWYGREVEEELDKSLQAEYTSRIMPVSPYQKKLIEEKKSRAVALYKTGLSMRAVGKEVGMSHSWVGLVIAEKLSPYPSDISVQT